MFFSFCTSPSIRTPRPRPQFSARPVLPVPAGFPLTTASQRVPWEPRLYLEPLQTGRSKCTGASGSRWTSAPTGETPSRGAPRPSRTPGNGNRVMNVNSGLIGASGADLGWSCPHRLPWKELLGGVENNRFRLWKTSCDRGSIRSDDAHKVTWSPA